MNDFLQDHDPDTLPLSFREAELATRYFGSLDLTMLSLYMSIAGGVSWEDVITPLRGVSEVWAFLFLFYISFTYFAVLLGIPVVPFCPFLGIYIPTGKILKKTLIVIPLLGYQGSM